ncbi:type III-A CRISPR-associated protein Cas10/Csm1 [Phaeodactylibacter xiamenensis]|uniref:type III-A CRISPR-associated protein Cas10/Csm1 n=1 Tax=Phaeodactylibacter xiamenensis TaxID=1524460 RepID=UPI003CCC1D00
MNRSTIYLSGLLHDIGKFWQRADPDRAASSKILSSETKRNEGLYCPQYNGRYSHKHVLWTAEFLDQHKSFFQSVISSDSYEAFFKATVKHHTPDQDDVFQLLLQKADHYASGVDRTGEWGRKDAEAERAWDSFKNVRMVSIFEGLLGKTEKYAYHIPITRLSLDEGYFPSSKEANPDGQTKYAELWEQFMSDFEQLKHSRGNAFSTGENLSFLLNRNACTVPSSTMHLPDVSLYDHLKSVGIFALCLFDYLSYHKRLTTPLEIQDDEAPFLLVGGDLSGIQNYIYDIISKDAARNLKGRSFYLQILVENAVEFLLNQLDLPWSAIVYASGGGFYLLAPNTPETVDTLNKVRKELADRIFEEHQTSLSLNIAWQEVSQTAIFGQQINEVWRKLTGKIARLKSQKFKEKIKNDYQFFFTPGEIGGKQVRDFITGEEFSEEDAQDYRDKKFGARVALIDNEEDQPVKLRTSRQIELGRNLRRTDFWVSSKTPVPQWRKYEFRIGGIEVYNYFFPEEKLHEVSNRYADGLFIRAFDLEKAGFRKQSAYFKGKNCIFGFTFYGGNDFPVKEDGDPVTFDDMAKMGGGANRLGILRMDVDNLGAIFIAGLDNHQRTFSRYSVLSRNLDFFFRGYLNKIWKDNFEKNSSIIYSGGDDLFIVGHWSAIIDFAKTINEDFKKWVCHNPNISISGGIALTTGKFPISKGAEFSAQAEKLAKEHNADGYDKNALTIFNVPLNWDKEIPIVENLKDQMVNLIPRKLPRGLLQKLLNYAEQARMQIHCDKNHSWRWHMAYDFSRAAKRQDKDAGTFYDLLKTAAFTDKWNGEHIPQPDYPDLRRTFLDLLEVAARWSEMETKEQ